MNVNIPKVSAEEFLDAVREGVHDAIWEMITNATNAPCGDFYDTVKQAVKEAMLQLKPPGR